MRDRLAERLVLERHHRRVEHERWKRERDVRDEQSQALRGMPVSRHDPPRRGGRQHDADHARHQGQRVGQHACAGRRREQDERNREVDDAQADAHRDGLPADTPPRRGQSRGNHAGPEGGGVEAARPEEESQSLGLERMQAEAQPDGAALAHDGGEDVLVEDEPHANRRRRDGLTIENATWLARSVRDPAPTRVACEPPALDEVAGDHDQREEEQRREQVVRGRPQHD